MWMMEQQEMMNKNSINNWNWYLVEVMSSTLFSMGEDELLLMMLA